MRVYFKRFRKIKIEFGNMLREKFGDGVEKTF